MIYVKLIFCKYVHRYILYSMVLATLLTLMRLNYNVSIPNNYNRVI